MSGESSAGRVLYEVSLDVDRAVADDFRAWLDGHAREIAGLDGFLAARVFEVRDPAPPAGRIALCVHYLLRDADALDAYLRDQAPRMRAEGLARFGGRFSAQRRVMDLAMECGQP